jgi:hypothetical protein
VSRHGRVDFVAVQARRAIQRHEGSALPVAPCACVGRRGTPDQRTGVRARGVGGVTNRRPPVAGCLSAGSAAWYLARRNAQRLHRDTWQRSEELAQPRSHPRRRDGGGPCALDRFVNRPMSRTARSLTLYSSPSRTAVSTLLPSPFISARNGSACSSDALPSGPRTRTPNDVPEPASESLTVNDGR